MRHEAMRIGNVEARLDRAVIASARSSGIDVAVKEHRTRPWASATFVGATHDLVIEAARGRSLGGWIGDLPEADLPVRGHLVASVAVDRIEDDGTAVRVSLAVLTIEA